MKTEEYSGRYIWDVSISQKIRVKEIREYKIEYDQTAESFFVTAHGYGFGKGVTIFGSKVKKECVDFVNWLTLEKKTGGEEK